jgi:AbrB family looped-hinge helix DNA binding protein
VPVATVTSKGQITIPKEIRDRLKLRKGARVRFTEQPDGSVTLRPQTRSLLDLAGMLKAPPGKHVTVEEMNEAVRRAAARSVHGR